MQNKVQRRFDRIIHSDEGPTENNRKTDRRFGPRGRRIRHRQEVFREQNDQRNQARQPKPSSNGNEKSRPGTVLGVF